MFIPTLFLISILAFFVIQLPETDYVDREIAKAKRFGMIGEYNKALKTMCNKLEIEYMESSSVLKAHPECYGGDGIHLSKAFYEKYWLRFIIREMGIVG